MEKNNNNQDELNRISAINSYGGRHLQNFKHEYRTYNVCLAAVTKDGSAIEFVPIEFLTKEMYAVACKSYGMALKQVPEKYKSATMFKDAVCSNGLALQYVPEAKRTAQLCRLAVKNNHLAFAYVPKTVLTPEFCAKAMKGEKTDWVSSIPDTLRSKEFFEELIDLEPDIIWNTPKQYRTIAFSKKFLQKKKYKNAAEAVKDNDQLAGMLNAGLYDHDVCLAIVQSENFLEHVLKATIRKNSMELSYGSVQMDKLMKYPDVCLYVVKKEAPYLEYAPASVLSQDLINEMIDSNPSILRYVPEKYKTKDLCEKAFAKDIWTLDAIPDCYKTPEMCLAAVKESGYQLKVVPDGLKTTEMCKIAVADEGKGTRYVPERLYDKELALLVLKNPGSIVYPLNVIPKQFLDYEMCKYAVSKEGRSLKEVPKEFVDYEMCLAAVKNTPLAAEFVPLKLFAPEIVEETTKRSDCFRFIPEEKMTEEILLKIAEQSPSQLPMLVPVRLRTEELLKKIGEVNPQAEYYVKGLK